MYYSSNCGAYYYNYLFFFFLEERKTVKMQVSHRLVGDIKNTDEKSVRLLSGT